MTTSRLYTGAARAIDAIPVVGTTAQRDARYPDHPLNFRVQNLESGAIERYTDAGWVADLLLDNAPTTVNAATQAGADWGAKVAAAINALPSTGGIVDATALTGTQSLSLTLTISKAYTTLLVAKDMTLNMGAYSIVVAGGAHGCRITSVGAAYGSLGLNGVYFAPQFNYTGSGSAFTIGDGTTLTEGFVAEDVGVRINAADTGAVGITINTVVYWHLLRPTILGSLNAGTTQVGIRLDGTHATYFCGWGTIDQPVMGRVYRGIHGTGTGFNTANAITINGGSLQGANNYASGSAGKGVYLEAGKGWFVNGLDIDNFERGIDVNGGDSHFVIRCENCDKGVYLDTGSSHVTVIATREDSTIPVNNGTDNIVIQAGTIRTNLQATAVAQTFGSSAGTSQAVNLKAAAGTTRLLGFSSGNDARWLLVADSVAETGSNAGTQFKLGAYDDSGVLIDFVMTVVRAVTGAITWTRKHIFSASTTSRATLNIPHGTAPSSPVDGDMWTTTAGLYVRINGSTVGPLT